MKNTFRHLARIWQPLLLILATVSGSLAQSQYANRVMSSFSVANEDNARDSDLTTSAALIPFLIGGASIEVAFPGLAQAGKPAGFFLKNGATLSLLGGASITTYLVTGSTRTAVETISLGGGLVNLLAYNAGVNQMIFTPTAPFNQIKLTVGGLINLQSIEVFEAYSTPVTPLPVVLTTFAGAATPGGARLSWATASEVNSAWFEVERSLDGVAFSSVGRVAAAGTSAQSRTYGWLDATPAPLGYYRLRQVDTDGTATFSPVVVVQAVADLRAGLVAYPNPATSWLTVQGAGGTLTILDCLGHPVRTVAVPTAAAPRLDVSALPAGVYVVQDGAGQRTRFSKVAE